MSTQVKTWQRFEAVRDDGTSAARDGQTPYDPAEILTLTDDERLVAQATVADGYGRETLWQDGDAGVSEFDFLWLVSDKDVLVELVLDRGGTADSLVLTAKANIPLVLASNTGAATSPSDTSQTTTKTIEEVSVQRNVADGQGDASVRLQIFS